MVSAAKKKLLVLDVNGLLLDTYFRNDNPPDCPSDGKVNQHHVYRRPYCNEFIEFCFENFEMGIWSSAKKHNVEGFINFIFGDLKSKLLFTWHQADCTDTGLKAPGNRYKPVFLKELSKLWNKVKPDLPWEKGDFGPSNTLLIDDSPYKALRNPPYTAVFPDPYKVSNNFDDSLGGALRKYLEGLATASDVQYYVKHHSFGQPPISEESPHWNLYRKILLPVEDSAPYMEEEKNDMVNAAIPNLEKSVPSLNREDGLHTGNVQHSELNSCTGKRKKKHRNIPVTSNNQSSVPGEEEGNDVVKVAVVNIEKCKSLENKKGNLQFGNGSQSESSLESGKHKKKRKNRLGTSTNQSSVPSMEEDNSVVNVAMLNSEKSISLKNIRDNLQSGNGLQSEVSSWSGKRKKRHKDSISSENIRDNLQSGNEIQSEVSLQNGKRKKRHKDRSLVPSMEEDNSGNRLQSEVSLWSGNRKKRHKDRSSVPSMEEDNSVVNMAMLNTEKSISSENIRDNLQSGNGLQSEVSSQSGKRKKRHKDHLSTNTNQSSVLSMEEENGVVNMSMLNMEKSISLENRKVNLLSGNGQWSESSSRSGKRKRRERDCPLTGTSESSLLGKQKVENGVAEMGMRDVGKSRSITQYLISQEHESCRIYRGYKNANLLSERGKPSETGLSQNSSFYNHKRKYKCFQNDSVSRGSASAVEHREDDLAEAIDIPSRKGYGTTVASFGQEAVAAQTDKEYCDNKPYTKFRDQNDFRYEKRCHHYKPAHFSPNPHMNSNRRSSSYCQRDSQASCFPGRQFQADRGHNKGFDPSIHTRAQSNFPPQPLKGYRNDGQDRWQMHDGFHLQHVPPCQSHNPRVQLNFPSHPLKVYRNDGQDRWPMHDGFHLQHVPPYQSHNPRHIGYPVCESYNTNPVATEFRGPLMQHQFQLHEQMRATDYNTQHQGHGRNFHHCKNNFRSKHGESKQFQK